MRFWNKLFRKPHNTNSFVTIPFVVSETERQEILLFSRLSKDDRMRHIMRAGDGSVPPHFHIMRYAIQGDPDANVKFAALKRIDVYASHPAIISMLRQMMEDNSASRMEPYFSMVLSRMGIITRDEFLARTDSNGELRVEN